MFSTAAIIAMTFVVGLFSYIGSSQTTKHMAEQEKAQQQEHRIEQLKAENAELRGK